MISLRLPSNLEDKLNKISKDENISKTEIIKQALISYMKEYSRKQNPYELGSELFGKYGSGNRNLSKDYKKLLKEKFHEKYSH